MFEVARTVVVPVAAEEITTVQLAVSEPPVYGHVFAPAGENEPTLPARMLAVAVPSASFVPAG